MNHEDMSIEERRAAGLVKCEKCPFPLVEKIEHDPELGGWWIVIEAKDDPLEA